MEERSKQQDENKGRENNETMQLNNERDISSIDQHEGNLEHGETGGKLQQNEERKNENPK
jgi:hypothetical protein